MGVERCIHLFILLSKCTRLMLLTSIFKKNLRNVSFWWLDLWFENYKSRVDMWKLSGWTKHALTGLFSTDLIFLQYSKILWRNPIVFLSMEPMRSFLTGKYVIPARLYRVFLNREYACLVAHVCRASCFRSESRILPDIWKIKSGTG